MPYVVRRLEKDAFPAIGRKPLAKIEPQGLVAMVKAIEKRDAQGFEKRAYQITVQIFLYAVAHGLVALNPATDVKLEGLFTMPKSTNYARLSARELPELKLKTEAYPGLAVTRSRSS